MTGGNDTPRRAAANILAEWANSRGSSIDVLRDRFLESVSQWEARDRALLTELLYGVTRHLPEIDSRLNEFLTTSVRQVQLQLLAVLRVGVYQLYYLDRVPDHAVVDEAVEHAKTIGGKKTAGFVNAVLRRAVRERGDSKVERKDGEARFDAWRVKWAGQWDEAQTESLIRFFSTIPPLGLRRNLLKTGSDEEWIELLKSEGVDPILLPDRPGYVHARSVRPDSLASFQRGETTVQDPGAGIPILTLDPQPGERILDLCGAPGGKAAAIWERMGGSGTLVTVDREPERQVRTRETLGRLGHSAVDVVTADVLELSLPPGDRVLIDVPCSGTGVAHRRADLAVRRGPEELAPFTMLQASLLDAAAELVRPGGILVYSTCSLEPEENQRQALAFDSRWEGKFRRAELPETLKQEWVVGPGEVMTWPPRDEMDGSYAVRWLRVE